MEAFQAYYNTNDSVISHHSTAKPSAPKEAGYPASTNIINNIVHINYGANINITTHPHTQNNFIFNHTAPINLNFYQR